MNLKTLIYARIAVGLAAANYFPLSTWTVAAEPVPLQVTEVRRLGWRPAVACCSLILAGTRTAT